MSREPTGTVAPGAGPEAPWRPSPVPDGPVASLDGVTRTFGETVALADVDLEIGAGQVVALLGQNGAGKTTLLSILLGLRRPDRGTARLFGQDPRDWRSRRFVGVTPQETDFPGTLRVGEVVDLVRAHYHEPLATADLLERFGLTDVGRRQSGGLSGGQRRRLAVALAFAGHPHAVFLDEPSAGLDVGSRRQMAAHVRSYSAAGGTVLLTTHDLQEAQELATRVVIIHRGRIVADGSVGEIRARAGLTRVRFRAGDLPALTGVERASRHADAHTLFAHDAGAVIVQLVAAGIPLLDLEVLPSSLEEAFLSVTGDEG